MCNSISVEGMLPEKAFNDRSKYSRSEKLPFSHAGIVPTKLHAAQSKDFNFFKFANVELRTPEISEENHKFARLVELSKKDS